MPADAVSDGTPEIVGAGFVALVIVTVAEPKAEESATEIAVTVTVGWAGGVAGGA